MIFESRQVSTPTTVGEELAALRQAAGFSVSGLAERAGVSVSIITAFEANDYGRLGPDIYTKQGIRRLEKAFAVEPETWQRRLNKEREGILLKKPDFAGPQPKHLVMPVLTHWLSRGALGVTVAGLVLYLGLGVGKMVAPPALEVKLPDGLAIREHEIEVRGLADPTAHVTINGGEVVKGEDGYFYERIGLAAGINVIEVTAKSKYGKVTTVRRRIVVQ